MLSDHNDNTYIIKEGCSQKIIEAKHDYNQIRP